MPRRNVRAQAALALETGALPPQTIGRTTIAWSPSGGLTLAIDGVVIVRTSTLNIVRAGFRGSLFSQRDAAWSAAPWQRQGGGQFATRIAENEFAAVSYRLSLTDDGAATVALTYRLKADIAAEVEYAAGYLSVNPLLGGAINGQRIKLAPPAAGRSQEQNRLAAAFTRLDLTTTVGPLRVEFGGNAPAPNLFDARGDSAGWAKAFPVLWMGIGSPAPSLTPKMGVQSAVFTFTPSGVPTPSPGTAALTLNGRARERSDTYLPAPPPRPVVIPTPKSARYEGAPFRLTPDIRLIAAPRERATAVLLADGIEARFGFRPALTPDGSAGGRRFIRIGGDGLSAPSRPEGYAVLVNDKQAQVVGRDDAGLLWGVQTLIQLLSADSTGPRIDAARIDDWPTLAIRGVHLFHGKNAREFHERLIARVFSPFKLNTLLLQAERSLWNADRSVAPPFAGTRDDLSAEIAFARSRGLTAYPLFQSFGHLEWLLTNPRNRSLAEDEATPYAINMSDPRALAYIEHFDAEIDDLFGAPAFHVGLDEVTMRGNFPKSGKNRTVASLFVENARHWREFFARRKKPIWMWADMAMHPSEIGKCWGSARTVDEAREIRAGLPRDIVMVDWQYGAHDSYGSLELLKREGFEKRIAATWFEPENIRSFAQAAAKNGALGAIQTTWCGYESKEDVLETIERRQFTAMALAAEYFWNGGGPGASALPYDFSEAFRAAYAGPDARSGRVREGWILDLGAARENVGDALRLGERLRVPSGELRLTDGVLYRLDGALPLSGRVTPSGLASVAITLPAGVREVRLILAAGRFAPDSAALGRIEVAPLAGETRVFPLVYGKNIAAWNDPAPLPGAKIVGRIETGGAALILRVVIVPIQNGARSVTLMSEGSESAPLLLAVTAMR